MVKTGDRVDRYLVEDTLGEGGMGRVFRAHDERLDRRVALKVLAKEAAEGGEGRARLLREARAVAKLDHPNVVQVYDVGEIDGSPYIAMELVAGRSLRALIGDSAVTPSERCRILIEIARGLSAAHEAGVVHRDVKPENVIVRPDGKVKVLDFGIARRTGGTTDPSAPTDHALSTLTAEGVKVGTPMYMAPEQIQGGAVDGRADQFAWAVTAHEIFAGRSPWKGADTLALIASIMTEDPGVLGPETGAPPALSAAIRRALSKKPSDRFASMTELVLAIEAATATEAPIPTSGPRPVQRTGQGASAPPSAPWNATSFGAETSHVVAGSYPPAPPPMPAFSRRYSKRELTDLFDRALSAQHRQLSFEEVSNAARWLSLTPSSVQRILTELTQRGALEPNALEQSARVMRLKRSGAIWGVFAAFFFLLNLFDRGSSWWFQYPTISIGFAMGMMAVRAWFPTGKRAQGHGDQSFEFDASRLAHYFSTLPAPPASRVRISAAEGPAPRSSQTEHLAEAEALAAEEAERARR